MSQRDRPALDTPPSDQILTPAEVADEWKIPEKTLAQWRYLGRGPEYLKLGGHVRYRRAAMQAWERECTHATTHGGTAA